MNLIIALFEPAHQNTNERQHVGWQKILENLSNR